MIDPKVHKPYIEGLLQSWPTITLQDIESKCFDALGIHFSLPMLCCAQESFQYSFKHVTVLAEEIPENKERRWVNARGLHGAVLC